MIIQIQRTGPARQQLLLLRLLLLVIRTSKLRFLQHLVLGREGAALDNSGGKALSMSLLLLLRHVVVDIAGALVLADVPAVLVA
jgi:hypothetical protein